jgi:hypothetical protein
VKAISTGVKLESSLSVPRDGYIGLSGDGLRQVLKYRKFANFPLTRAASLLLYESREKAGPVPSAESVFFSGPASQFSAVYDC